MLSGHEQYIENLLQYSPPFKLWEDFVFNKHIRSQIKNQLKEGTSTVDYPYVHISLNRPVSFIWAKQLDPETCLIATTESGNRSYVASMNPLSVQDMEKLELTPIGDSRSYYLYNFLGIDKLSSFVLGKNSRRGNDFVLSVGVVSRDPSQPDKWRVTEMEEDIGPIGHTLYDTKIEAFSSLIGSGFINEIDPSIVDELASSFIPLVDMS